MRLFEENDHVSEELRGSNQSHMTQESRIKRVELESRFKSRTWNESWIKRVEPVINKYISTQLLIYFKLNTKHIFKYRTFFYNNSFYLYIFNLCDKFWLHWSYTTFFFFFFFRKSVATTCVREIISIKLCIKYLFAIYLIKHI